MVTNVKRILNNKSGMYDKVNIWADRTIMQGVSPESVAHNLDNPEERIILETGEVKILGNLDNLKISVRGNGVSIVGSMPKYLYGNNIYPLDRYTTAEAFKKLEDAMHLNLTDAQVTGLEFGTTFVMKYPVEAYLGRLGDIPKLVRCMLAASTLYYQHKGKQQPKTLCFYDKGAEEKSKGLILPVGLEDANLLRYELRYKGRLPYQIGCPIVNVSTLSAEEFYRLLVKRYQDFYYSITKYNQITSDVKDIIKTPKDAFQVFTAMLIGQRGQSVITDFMDWMKAMQVFEDRKQYNRFKNMALEALAKGDITETDELIRELNDEIKNVGAYV